MAENIIVQFPQIGEVHFKMNATVKYLRISLKAFDGVRVTVPKGTSTKDAMAFVETKKDWILQAKLRIESQEKRYTIFTPDTVFRTQNRQLILLPWKSGQFRAQISKDALKIFYPQEADLQTQQAQKIIREYIIETIRKEANEYLPLRTEQLAAEHGFMFHGVTVKNIKSRWGSCSATNHINLNMHLMRLPQYLSDYVILHELTHTVQKNHGKPFWQSLNRITGGKARRLAADMRKYNAVRF